MFANPQLLAELSEEYISQMPLGNVRALDNNLHNVETNSEAMSALRHAIYTRLGNDPNCD